MQCSMPLTCSRWTEATGLEVQSESSYTRSGGGEFGANQAVIDAVFDPRILERRPDQRHH